MTDAAYVSSTAIVVRTANQLYPVSLPIVTALLAKGKALLPDIPAARRDFYTGHTLLQQSIQAYGCSALASLCNAVVSAADGNNAVASGNLTAALGAIDDMFAAERAAEYGQWRGLYLYDRLVDFQRARTLLRQSAAALAKAPVPPARPSVYYTFYDYQLAVEQNYPYFFESSEWNLWQFVHISCSPCDNATNSGATPRRPSVCAAWPWCSRAPRVVRHLRLSTATQLYVRAPRSLPSTVGGRHWPNAHHVHVGGRVRARSAGVNPLHDGRHGSGARVAAVHPTRATECNSQHHGESAGVCWSGAAVGGVSGVVCRLVVQKQKNGDTGN